MFDKVADGIGANRKTLICRIQEPIVSKNLQAINLRAHLGAFSS
jgi:hypothetical protein